MDVYKVTDEDVTTLSNETNKALLELMTNVARTSKTIDVEIERDIQNNHYLFTFREKV